jgi:hypothetical protein
MIKIIYEEEDDSIKETYQNQQKHNKMNNVLKNLNQAPEVFNHKFGFFVAYEPIHLNYIRFTTTRKNRQGYMETLAYYQTFYNDIVKNDSIIVRPCVYTKSFNLECIEKNYWVLENDVKIIRDNFNTNENNPDYNVDLSV